MFCLFEADETNSRIAAKNTAAKMETPEQKLNNSKRQAWRDAFVMFTCVLFFLTGSIPIMILAGHNYSAVFSISPDATLPSRHICGLLLTMLASLALGGYLGIFIWLVCARFLFRFSRSEVLRCSHTSFYTRFDDWLVDQIYPEISKGE